MLDIRDILGLNAPKLQSPIIPGEGDEYDSLTDAEIDQRVAALLQAHSGMHVLSEDDQAAEDAAEDADDSEPTDDAEEDAA